MQKLQTNSEEVSLNPCPDCETNEHVSANAHADSYYACMFWNVACRNPVCQQRFWPDDKMPQCTGNFKTEEKAVEAWQAGDYKNHSFSVGGRWTGD